MIFLNPSILFGLVAASIPILIHLLNLRKLKKIEFSSIRFLKELQKTKIRKIKFKQWLLLIIRTLIIMLIISAFARPTIRSVSISGTGSTAKTTAVVIIDNSYSMSAVSENGTYFNQSKLIAGKIAEQLQEGDELYLLFSSPPQPPEKISGAEQLSARLERGAISFSGGNFDYAVQSAIRIIENSNNFNKELYIISDFQKNNFNISDSNQIHKIKNANASVYLINAGDEKISNLAVADLKINNQIFQKGKNINVSVKVKNFSPAEKEKSVVSLFVNNTRSAQKLVELNAGETEIANFETSLKDTGLVEIYAELEDDDIIYDNKMFAAIYIPPVINILIASDLPNDDRFVYSALSARNENNFKIKRITSEKFNSQNLKNFEAVIVIGGEKIGGLTKLSEYVKNGGCVILFPSSKPNLSAYKKVCGKLGVNSPVSIIRAGKNNAIYFGKVRSRHPLFDEIFRENKPLKIDSPDIIEYINYDNNSGIEIIALQNGADFLNETKSGGGRILQFASAPSLSSGNFPVKSIFAPLIFKSIYYLGGGRANSEKYISNENINFKNININSTDYSIITPSGTVYVVPFDSVKNSKFVECKNTNLPGVYTLKMNGELIDFASVNADRKESSTERMGNSGLKKFLSFFGKFKNIFFLNKNDSVKDIVYQARFGSELRKLFLIAALVLAILEMLISRSSRKDIAEIIL